MKKRLNDSGLFKELVLNSKVKNAIAQARPDMAIDLSRIDEPLTTIEKRVNTSLKSDILNSTRNGEIKILCNTNGDRLPRYISAIGKIDSSGLPTYYTEISYFCKNIDKEGNIDIFIKDLLALLQNAYIYKILNDKWEKYAYNTTLLINGSKVYSRMLGKIMDKQFAINIEPIKRDIVHFLLAKFFIIGMCGFEERVDSDIVNNIALKSCIDSSFNPEYIDKYINDTLTDDDFTDVIKFFELLKKIDGFSKLSVRSFVEQYVRMYGEGTLLTIDCLPMFLGMCHAVAVGSNIHRTYLINSVVEKELAKYVIEFNKITQ